MSDFQKIIQDIDQARAHYARSSADAFRGGEQLKQVEAQLHELKRRFSPNNPAHKEEQARLLNKKRELEAQQRETTERWKNTKDELGRLNPIFWEKWTDPRLHMDQLNDDIPVLLFPLRLETRFKTVNEQPQLWVRVYPDDCLVDSFEEMLSETELHVARIFWQEYFRAAGIELDERAAWRGLVASHGAGRASWIYRQFRPQNPLSATDTDGNATYETKPKSRNTNEILLVIPADESLTTAEKTALEVYWAAVWKANGQSNLTRGAFDALKLALGDGRAAMLATGFVPYNLKEKPVAPLTYEAAKVRVFFVIFPKKEEAETKTRTWMQAARVNMLPERFVLMGFRGDQKVVEQLSAPVQTPFAVSPDPTATAEEEFQFDEHGNLNVSEGIRWMLDFDEAVRRGLGFRVDLSQIPQPQRGFDRLFVLGIRLSADATKGQSEVETLFQHHYFSRTGFAFLPQGTPTNNTEEGNAGHSRTDDADVSFDFVFKKLGQFSETQDIYAKRDGQLFAEALGLRTDWLKEIPHANQPDQAEARAMNTALWPATLGYFMDTLLQPVFNDDQIYYTRWFFNRFVSGRGPIPAIRIGRQPYGILPTTAFDKITWPFGDDNGKFISYNNQFQEQRGTGFRDWLQDFYVIIKDLYENTWKPLAVESPHIGGYSADRDAHQTLLSVLGLNPDSVSFYQRYATTKKQTHNVGKLWGLSVFQFTLPANEKHDEAFKMLSSFGYSRPEMPKLFDLYWKVWHNQLLGPVIQEGALSEMEALRTVTTNNRNYIEWLHEWAEQSFDTIRVQDGFQNDKWPNSLLYILLKHALELGYYDAGFRLLDEAQLLDNQQKLNLRAEPHFFQIQTSKTENTAVGAVEKSRYDLLYSPAATVTGDPTLSVANYVTKNLQALFSNRYLNEQLRSLQLLSKTPTARLERLLAEHLDTSTYRLDAWITGLISYALASTRFARRGDNEGVAADVPHRQGIYVGAYGWLENVRSENKNLTPVQLRGELNETFNEHIPENQQTTLMRDDKNEGYIHAPSLNHALTAAVLRNGYIANATPAQPELLKVNLSSERVRWAMGIIDGIRNGQNLAALLGYQFERGLHDRYALAETDKFIYPLRKTFPLFTRNQDLPDGVPVEAIEARNVVNGLNLIRHVRNADGTVKSYPFGFPNTQLPAATDAQKVVLNDEINRLLDVYDAVSDLAVAEGVHQVVMGNYDRAAATLDAYGQATFPPIPDVVQTPRSGIGLTHRVALQLDMAAAAVITDNPRAKIEPSLQKWVNEQLPAPTAVSCRVSYKEAVTNALQEIFVTQAELNLQAIDLLYLINPENMEVRSELEDRLRDFVFRNVATQPRPDVVLTINYTHTQAGHFTFFQLAALLRSLRALVLRSRPLRPTDAALPTEATPETITAPTINRARLSDLLAAVLDEKTTKLLPLQAQINATFPVVGGEVVPDKILIFNKIDNFLNDILTACNRLGLYGLPQTSTGVFHETKGLIFKSLLEKAAAVVTRWQGKLDEYTVLIANLPAVPTDADIETLLRAERLVSTAFVDTTGKNFMAVLADVEAKKTAFENQKTAFENFTKTTKTSLSDVLIDLQSLLPVADFDLQSVDLVDIEKMVVTLAEDLQIRVQQLITDIDKRLKIANDKLTDHDAQASADARVQLLTEAARVIFGDEFLLIPSFSLSENQANEWQNAYNEREKLLDYHKNTLENNFVVDDWLYGTARVREKMHHLENWTLLADAFGKVAPELRPVQFPFDITTPWLAVEFPKEAKDKLERENLLYTAIYPVGFNKNQPQGGLLLDEWTEVIPAETETTGVAFHFDKPNAEPPQTLLLCTTPRFTGQWSWDDLVDTLHDTLDRAKIRAVEPDQLDQTELSVFLPATVLATTWQPITIAADLSVVNQFITKVK